MTTPADNDGPTLESIAKDQKHLTKAVNALSAGVTALSNAVTALSSGQGTLSDGLRAVSEGGQALIESMRTLATEQARLSQSLSDMNKKLDGLKGDIGMVRGGHARGELLRNTSLIADGLGYQAVSELPRTTLIALGKAALAGGMPKNAVESFRNADTVLLAQHESGRQAYIAIEVSFTVDGNDVRRAARNADYLEKFTGLEAHGVVAGIEILRDAQEQVDGGNIHFYRIAKRYIEPQ